MPLTPQPDARLESPDRGSEEEIVAALESYRKEAEDNRRGGPNGRDGKWSEILDLYWGRHDFGGKASWQAQETLPEVATFIDRFAAALKEALVAGPEGFYTVLDPSDKEGDLTRAVKRMVDVWLSTSGRDFGGHIIGFPAVFEEQVKMGALMAMSGLVTWRDGRVAIDTVDPRSVWLDHTGRGLYRIRRWEVDRHELTSLASKTDSKGKPIYNAAEIERLVQDLMQEAQGEKEALAGTGQQILSSRIPVTLHEYLATIIGTNGKPIHNRSLSVVANNRFLIRGPEKNPFSHGRDWLVFTPLITAPLSPYGRSYAEDFGRIAHAFTELTNLILDAVQTSAMNAFAIVPEMLTNPDEAMQGVSPNKVFTLEAGNLPSDFAKAIELGRTPPEVIQVWSALKAELREASGINEIALGQFAPKGRTSATEISQTQQNASAQIRSIAQTVETRWLEPVLDLVWKTGIQHVKRSDGKLREAAGPMFDALIRQRGELTSRPVTFQARGITTLIQRTGVLRSLMQVLQIMAANDQLLQAFLQVADINRLVRLIFELSNIDIDRITATEREQKIQGLMGAIEQRQAAAGAGGGGASPAPSPQSPAVTEARDVAELLGIAR